MVWTDTMLSETGTRLGGIVWSTCTSGPFHGAVSSPWGSMCSCE